MSAIHQRLRDDHGPAVGVASFRRCVAANVPSLWTYLGARGSRGRQVVFRAPAPGGVLIAQQSPVCSQAAVISLLLDSQFPLLLFRFRCPGTVAVDRGLLRAFNWDWRFGPGGSR